VSDSFDPAEYGRAIAADYDDVWAELSPDEAVATVADLVGGGSVLELGIGTGRLALPLVERGVEVAGIEGSPEMVELLRRKPGGDGIEVAVGDFADTSLGRTYDLVLLALNTVFALPSQDAQVACFRNAARHLEGGGRFVVEAWIPDLGAFRDGRSLRPVEMGTGRVVLETAELHQVGQIMRTNKTWFDARGARTFPANHRYAWPEELDLMARLAGMRLEQRWEDWSRRPFGDRSTTHVSVWRKVSEAAW
jgi:SAM-dependent methyltransferase